jgi:hypothetical protein
LTSIAHILHHRDRRTIYDGNGLIVHSLCDTRFSPVQTQVHLPVVLTLLLGPLQSESQQPFELPRCNICSVCKTPHRVLDAPELADDFYLDSSTNAVCVDYGSCVHLWTVLCQEGSHTCPSNIFWAALHLRCRDTIFPTDMRTSIQIEWSIPCRIVLNGIMEILWPHRCRKGICLGLTDAQQ